MAATLIVALTRLKLTRYYRIYHQFGFIRGLKRSRSRVLWSVCLLVSGCGIAAVQGPNIQAIFDSVARENPSFAISASYVENGQDPVVMTQGPTQFDGSTMVANDARWHLGSISKSFTSTLVMRLVQRGVLELDTPIINYLPADRATMHPDWQMATLRQLLSHTSGLPKSAPYSIRLRTWNDAPFAGRRAALSAMWGEPLRREVGNFYYSNLGYVLAGLIVEEVTQTSWEDLILSDIAEPLGLTSLGFGPPLEVDAAWGHGGFLSLGIKRPADPNSVRSDNPRWMGPAGTIHLSMADLARWGQAHLDACQGLLPNFLTRTSCEIMQTPVSDGYALGWSITIAENGEPVIWHNGSNTKWYAELALFPDQGIVIGAATNVHAPRRVHGLVLGIRDSLSTEKH